LDPKLGAEVAGKVIRVLGFAGKKVKKGELLAEIDAKDFEIQARTDSAEIARLTTQLEQADRLVERQAKLVEKGFVSQNVVDDATAQRNAQRDQLAAARAASRRGATSARRRSSRRWTARSSARPSPRATTSRSATCCSRWSARACCARSCRRRGKAHREAFADALRGDLGQQHLSARVLRARLTGRPLGASRRAG
jgi:multidrug efflux pump subunit AcrA (membrane-fusion protein)